VWNANATKLAALSWAERFNNRRLLGMSGSIPPAGFEAM